MARLARFVAPGLPHYVTQRGLRREPIFFELGDYALYRDLLTVACRKARVVVWAYCLMPDHVHLILVPAEATGLARALSETHRRYAGYVNARAHRTGHLFQGRFGSVILDEPHLLAAARHLSLNPVRARLVKRAKDWRWSSLRAHLAGEDDGLVRVRPLLGRVGSFADFLRTRAEAAELAALRGAEGIGRPIGSPSFLEALARKLGRKVEPGKRGQKPKEAQAPAGSKKGNR